MITIPNADAEYARWLSEHPNGFVLNTRRRRTDPTYMVLHTASCWTISPARHGLAPGALTQIDYAKVCAPDVEELRRWVSARGRADGSFSKQCGKCGADRLTGA